MRNGVMSYKQSNWNYDNMLRGSRSVGIKYRKNQKVIPFNSMNPDEGWRIKGIKTMADGTQKAIAVKGNKTRNVKKVYHLDDTWLEI